MLGVSGEVEGHHPAVRRRCAVVVLLVCGGSAVVGVVESRGGGVACVTRSRAAAGVWERWGVLWWLWWLTSRPGGSAGFASSGWAAAENRCRAGGAGCAGTAGLGLAYCGGCAAVVVERVAGEVVAVGGGWRGASCCQCEWRWCCQVWVPMVVAAVGCEVYLSASWSGSRPHQGGSWVVRFLRVSRGQAEFQKSQTMPCAIGQYKAI